MLEKEQGQSVNNWQACILCGETFDNENEHFTICSQRGKVNVKKTQRKSCKYFGKIFNNITEHELECKTQLATSKNIEGNVETIQVDKQSRYFQLHKSEVQNNVFNFQKVFKYCKKPFNNIVCQ